MGHERVGFLPRTKKWVDVVMGMRSVYSDNVPVSDVAAQTLQNVRKQYETLFQDEGVVSIFAFLVAFSRACRYRNPQDELKASGINVPDKPNLLSIVKALKHKVPINEVTSEYGQLAIAAAADAIGYWSIQNTTKQLPLFEPSNEYFESWRELGKGSGFCELTRMFFGRLTERYLNYFLDRAASSAFSNISQYEQFHKNIHNHLDDVSKHAFETAKITQSFAAGWFNSHTQDKVPNLKEIEGFLAIAVGKLREERRREEGK